MVRACRVPVPHEARVRIEVTDDGIGISPEDQERLFSEFVRIRREGTAVGSARRAPGSA